jgi:excinuclease ABC subunit B
VPDFKLEAPFAPAADQPQAIAALAEGLRSGQRAQTLLGATGTGKTMTMAGVIEAVQRPTLVMAHNKTLAAQLCNEFRSFFPHNAVEYFVSYYDYYQPEAYVPSKDLYIEKDSAINEEIDRLRHAATEAVLTRRDVIVVASVSCIYALGSPQRYRDSSLLLRVGQAPQPPGGEAGTRDDALRRLVRMQYGRNDTVLERGSFRVRGDTLEVFPSYESAALRVSFFGDEVEGIMRFDPLTGEVVDASLNEVPIYPATHYNIDPGALDSGCSDIEAELAARCLELEEAGKPLEAHRLSQRTRHDLEMLREIGYCSGIENYTRTLDGRPPGARPYCLLDYFPDDFICLMDESHQTLPQVRGMQAGDRSRKQTLIDYGFRLPSALDNRPQTIDEFLSLAPQIIFVSATPGEGERQMSGAVVEQIVRPTGIVDPRVEVRPTQNQVDDLLGEVKARVEADERVLVTTLTKKMAEDLAGYLVDVGVRARYLHSDIDTIERIEIIRDLRLGAYDVLVGVNLLREGLDLPEVSLVAILDADKEGFLRGETALIQTIGRAARHLDGMVIMYSDHESRGMRAAIDETDRRRAIQEEHNRREGISPQGISKEVSDIVGLLAPEGSADRTRGKGRGKKGRDSRREAEGLDAGSLDALIIELEEEMAAEAQALRFERCATLRDEIRDLRRLRSQAQSQG